MTNPGSVSSTRRLWSRGMCNALVVTLAVAAGACGRDQLLSPQERAELGRAQAKWTARGFADYTYEYQQQCFCPTELNQWTRVTIRGGAVAAAVSVDSGAAISAELLHMWNPVDSLFARLTVAAHEDASRGVYSDIIVQYDATLGFPIYAEWKERQGVADAGVIYRLRNVVALTP